MASMKAFYEGAVKQQALRLAQAERGARVTGNVDRVARMAAELARLQKLAAEAR